MNRIKFLLIAVVILGFVLRFYQLGKTPNGLEWDEVAIGYDAYSVLKTGRDQFGKFLPLTFRSIDDYKPPLYEYLAIPPIALFGLNAYAVRFPSAFFGSLTVLLTFFLVKELLRKVSIREDGKNIIALLSSFLLAVSPWHLQFSRTTFEVNLGDFLLVSGVTAFLLGLRKKNYLILSSLIFGLGFYSYHSVRVVMPFLFLVLIAVNLKKLLLRKKEVIFSILMFFLLFIPLAPSMFSPEVQMRLRVTNVSNIFNDLTMNKKMELTRAADNIYSNKIQSTLFHSDKIILARTVLNNYMVHFSPDFLFINGDVPLHHAPDFGLLYFWEALFLITGFIVFFRKYLNSVSLILIAWFLVAPVPAAVTLQVPHAVRTELFLPTFQIFTAIGLYEFILLLKKFSKYKTIVLGIITLLFLYNCGFYFHQYYQHLNFELSDKWLYGRQEAALYTDSVKDRYQKIYVSPRLEQPHLFWLFYTAYDPKKYLSEGGTVSGGWAEEKNHFDKYLFTSFDYYKIRKEKNLLLVGIPDDFDPGADKVKVIKYLDGKDAIWIVAP
ncbi:MAG: hypothetical protein UT63_C0003G0022 [Candidatus Gottesmanbacteria bacterium GW2011_GWC2_39_8]|uniref:Glycosyltransferase RgtA/B/C/D-like domain-containing protein n=1 Tax=Candidatus Gottesmanbacteria bacterium GW2011_GWC2_39_8 TaxID=1618450 RepID=A0A0G0QAE5_9BACT|nr:MAG: hypothetical protein UT63_C0003G0022 [Candidatus Gottesmanbacteria bacterium GW2011_GWC2_39_8]